MYPIRLGYNVAKNRINRLIKNRFPAEAFLTSVFTVEKMLRRTLKQLIISAGFCNPIANKVLKGIRGLEAIKDNWEIYDPKHRKLTQILSQKDWNLIAEAQKLRNEVVHGVKVRDLNSYNKIAKNLLKLMDKVKGKLETEYGFSGWTRNTIRKKSVLHKDPRVSVK